jgi:hypothetical protein
VELYEAKSKFKSKIQNSRTFFDFWPIAFEMRNALQASDATNVH